MDGGEGGAWMVRGWGGVGGHLSQFRRHSLNQLPEKVAATIKLGRLAAHLEIAITLGLEDLG